MLKITWPPMSSPFNSIKMDLSCAKIYRNLWVSTSIAVLATNMLFWWTKKEISYTTILSPKILFLSKDNIHLLSILFKFIILDSILSPAEAISKGIYLRTKKSSNCGTTRMINLHRKPGLSPVTKNPFKIVWSWARINWWRYRLIKQFGSPI